MHSRSDDNGRPRTGIEKQNHIKGMAKVDQRSSLREVGALVDGPLRTVWHFLCNELKLFVYGLQIEKRRTKKVRKFAFHLRNFANRYCRKIQIF